MIPRYTRPEVGKIFEPENKFRIWLEIETLAAEAMEQQGTIPKGVAKAVRERGKFDVARIDEIEREVKHDVIAFLTNLAEHVGEEARFVHQGMTSSDVGDTAFAYQLTQSADALLIGVQAVADALKKRALEHKDTICIGRSHGIHGEPTTFGLKLLGHYQAFARAIERMKLARKEIAICKLSGAVGNYANIDPFVESYVAEKMGLTPEFVATQVIPRDRHATFYATLAVIASSLENLAVEIRHLQRTELREAEEFFAPGQKGSSAMPHKRNPILSENVTGLARIVRAAVIPALENVALWHERDISHSATERTLLTDAIIALDFILHRMAGIIDGLVVYPETMQRNLVMTKGLYASQRVMLALTQKGVSREDAYRLVQKNAMQVWDQEQDFLDLLILDQEVTTYIKSAELKALASPESYLKHIDGMFRRVLQSA
jgi:adenylosuccinate lyase